MAKLGGLVKVEVNRDGEIYFREPTTEEWNVFRDASTQALASNDYKVEMQLTADFFDAHFEKSVEVVVETPEGDIPLDKESLKYIPDRNKYSCVNAAFLTHRVFIPKN